MENSKTLQNNKISQFILRIDLTDDTNINYKELALILKDNFDSFKTELHTNYNINIGKKEVDKEDFIIYVLGTLPKTCVKIDSFAKSIIIESSQYENNSVYKSFLQNIITALRTLNSNMNSKRIGMRYINNFQCSKISDITRIFNITEAKALKEAVNMDGIARAIILHEYQKGSNLIRVQCGIPNKFFPSVIKNYDLILDIDVYSGGVQSIDTWTDTIRDYNHQAYDTFIKYIKDAYLTTLK